MAAGILGSADLAVATNTLLFTVDATPQTLNVRFANRNATAARIRLAIGTGASPALKDYVDYDVTVQGFGVLEDTGLVASLGEKVWAYSDTANVSVRAHGI